MTLNDKLRFGQCFNKLAVALKEDIDAPKMAIYFDVLGDLPIESVEMAAGELARESKWFPKTSEWRESAERIRNTRAIAAASPDGRVWNAECGTCDDTGWEVLACSGRQQCGREKEHGEHYYGVPCPCRLTNRTYQRRLAEQRERARGRRKASES